MVFSIGKANVTRVTYAPTTIQPTQDMMKLHPFAPALVGFLFLLGACSRPEPSPAAVATPSAGPASVPVVQPQAPKVATAERIEEIEASGQTGLWSSVTEVCAKDVKLGLHTTLTWNVKDRGTEKVVVYATDIKKVERHFGQGGPVGEKETGPWLRPGVSFQIRDHKTGEELGRVVIGEKPCEP